MEFHVERYAVGDLGANCYFVINDETKEMVIIDPGGNGSLLAQKIKKASLKPVAILLTHGHVDHAHHAALLSEEYHIPIWAHEAEKELLADPKQNLSTMFVGTEVYHADRFFREPDVLEIAGFSFRVLHTPGHTPGGSSFYLKEQGIVFTGDSLFCRAIGRSDFSYSSAEDLLKGIREKLMVLPKDTIVKAGHMMETTIGKEAEKNQYI